MNHITDYLYENQASLCHNIMFQVPYNHPFQKVVHFEYNIYPSPSYEVMRTDFFGNKYLYFSIKKAHKKLTVVSESTIELTKPAWIGSNPEETPQWEEVAAQLKTTKVANDVRQFYLGSEHVVLNDDIRRYACQSFIPGKPIMSAMLDLTKRLYSDFTFTPGFTDITTPTDEVFKHRKGVCQDYAHLQLACLRSIGLAARYVSGYIETLPPPGKPKLVGADASHAWVAVYIPDLGWVEFDATNNLLVADKHIRVAVGRDFADVTPLKGIVYSVGKQEMRVSVDVRKPEERSF